MYYVYVLKSCSNNWFYVGLTKNVDKRLKEHNEGKTRSTKLKKPFDLIFKKSFDDRFKARDFEKFLKIRSNKEKLLRFLNYM